MKQTKWTIILQAVLMYIAHGFFLYDYLFMVLSERDNAFAGLFLCIGVGFLLLAAGCGIAGLIRTLVGLRKGISSPVKTTFIVKFVLIPWYIMNFYYGLMIGGAMANPFLVMLIPVLLFLSVCVTYAFMVLTGIPNVLYTFKALKDRRVKPSAILIVGIVLHFVFVADVVGAWLLFRAFKKSEAEPETDAPSGEP